MGAGRAPLVKDTHEVKRKRQGLPQMQHEMPTSGNWSKNRYIVNNYILLDVLGAGSYAEVRLAKDRNTEMLYAVKVINRSVKNKLSQASKKNAQSLEDVKREIAIMKKLNHPHVLRLYEVMDDPNVNKLYLVLEYMKGGDLMQLQRGDSKSYSCNPMPDYLVLRVLAQVAQGLKYLHSQNIIHGDIKPQNILLYKPPIETGTVKIADFGISKTLHVDEETLQETAGTPAFMCPEICEGIEYNGRLADVWALGATMYMLRFGRPPFIAKKVIQLCFKIINDPLEWPFEMDKEVQDILISMLEKDPDTRASLPQVLQKAMALHHTQLTKTHKKPPPQQAPSNYKPISINSQDIYMSINNNTVTKPDEEEANSAKNAPPKAASPTYATLSSTEEGRRADAFRKKHSSRSVNHHTRISGTKSQLKHPPQPHHQYQSAQQFQKHQVQSTPQRPSQKPQHFEHQAPGHHPTNTASSASTDGGQGSGSVAGHVSGRTSRLTGHRMTAAGRTCELPPRIPGRRPGASRGDISSDESSSDESESGSESDGRNVSRLDSGAFDEVMDTLAAQPRNGRFSFGRFRALEGLALAGVHFHASVDLHNPVARISAAWHTLKGNRPEQEDRVTVIPDMSALIDHLHISSGNEGAIVEQLERLSFFGMFDGHNGARCASELQHTFHLALSKHRRFLASPSDALENVCPLVDHQVCRKLAQKSDECGSTACIAVHDDRRRQLIVGNVGDCRCVLSRGGKAVELTSDHRLTRLDERQRIEKAGGLIVSNRVNGMLAVSRSFGDVQHKGKDDAGSVVAIPEIRVEPLVEIDEFFVLATDGLWDVMQSQQVVNFVRLSLNEHKDMERAAKEIAEEALTQGTVDNVSVVVVSFHQVASEAGR